jgi:hypothetical protein
MEKRNDEAEITMVLHCCSISSTNARKDFRAQPFQRLQNERQSALDVIFAVVNFSVYAPDHHLRTHDKVSLHGDQCFAKLILRAYSARKSAASRRLRCASHGAFGEQVVSERRIDDRNGFVLKQDWKAGRDAQSNAFFKTLGISWLYSGVAIRTPSLSAMSFFIFSTAGGPGGQSRSSL